MTFYDKVATDLVSDLVKSILEPDRKLLAKRFDEIIQRNNEILSVNHRGFRFNNNFYEKGGQVMSKLNWEPSLSASLVEEVVALEEFRKQLNADQQAMREVFQRLVQSCKTVQEERDALPECVSTLDWRICNLKRVKPEAWTIQNDPIALSNYLKILPKIHTYCAMRLMT